MNDKVSISRRTAMVQLAAGAAAVAVSSVAAKQPTSGATPPIADDKPTSVARPAPPFPAQRQAPPGLISQMTPRPDHGETSYRGSGKLKGRKALLTGGDSGIGRAAAIAFAREGADVAINYLPEEESDAQEVIAYIRETGRKAIALPGDIRDEEFCNELVDTAAGKLGGLDILVNSAGWQQAQTSITDITTEQFDRTLKTNLYGLFWITKAAVAHLQPGASIINLASVAAYDTQAFLLDYGATKSAIVAFTRALSKQLGSRNIRVNAVAPGPIWTPLITSGGVPPQRLIEFGKISTFGRPGQPAELASILVMLAGNEATFTTGGVVGATGGFFGP